MDDMTKEAIETLTTELSPQLASKVSEAVGKDTATALTPLQESVQDVSKNSQQLLEAVSTLAQHNHQILEAINRLPDQVGVKLKATEEKLDGMVKKATEAQQKLEKTGETLSEVKTGIDAMAAQQNSLAETVENLRQSADANRTDMESSRKQQKYVLFGILGITILHLMLAFAGVL